MSICVRTDNVESARMNTPYGKIFVDPAVGPDKCYVVIQDRDGNVLDLVELDMRAKKKEFLLSRRRKR